MSTETRRRLIVSRHAVAAYGRRRNDPRSLAILAGVEWSLDKLRREGFPQEELERLLDFYRELEDEIRECVMSALAEHRMLDYKPPGFVLYRRKKTALPPGQRFVRCDEDSNYGFILKRTSDGDDVVVTTLTKVGVRR